MKTTKFTILAAAVIGMFLSRYAFSQVTGDYRSVATGNWSEASTWEMFDGTNWVPATNAPTGTEAITVRGQDTVRVDVALSIAGYVKVEATGVIEVTTGSLEFGDGSTYEHARDAGSIPTATWGQGSTLLLTGTVQDAPANRNQNFYNVTFNTPKLGRNRDMGWNGITIGGDVRVISTGVNRWQMTTAAASGTATFTIMGDVIVEAGQFAVQGTGNAFTTFIVHHYGNINVTGGNFSISRGSQGNGTGTTIWYLYEGNFSMSNATTQNSNPTPGNAKFVFAKSGTQTLGLGEGNTIQKLPLEVSSGTTLDVGVSVIGGSDVFILKDGATLITAHPGGINGNLQTTGQITLSKKANYTFNGTEAQFAGLLLPDSVNVLTISNSAGVSFNDTLWSAYLMVLPEAIMQVDTLGGVTADSGSVAGTVVNKGVLEAVKPLEFGEGSVYEHARDGGSIPSGVWNEGSTLLMTGTVNTAPDNRNQNYYNITFNTPKMLSNRDMGLDDVTIGGNIRVENTGSARWRLTSAAPGDIAIVTIMGDVIVEGGSFETQGTSNALTVFEVHHYGNVVVIGGNFSVARGSQGSGSGSTRWYLHEGNFSMSNATTQNSNPTNAWFVFDKDGVQTLELSSVTYGGGGLAIEVASGTTLDFGMSELGGNGLFMLNEGATLATAHANGIAGAVQSTGNLTFNEGANYIFNGTTAQVTSTLMPTTVNNLTIDNEAGVKLSQKTTINGVLRLVAGEFDNTIPFTLGPNGSISYEGGRLKVPVSVVERLPEIPTEFALFQNYPNPFNPSTTILYQVPRRTHVMLKIYDVRGREVAELVNREHDTGAYETVWNAQGLASGVYYYRISAGDFTSVRKLVLMK